MAETNYGAYGGYASAAGGVLSAIQAYMQGAAARKVARYNAEVAEANALAQQQAAAVESLQQQRLAVIARQDQQIVREAQSYREARARERQADILGTAEAIVGASGLMLTGSPLAVYEETLQRTELDILAQRYQAALQERAFGDEATQREYAAEMSTYGGAERLRVGRQQAGLARAEGDQAYLAGITKAGASLLGTGTSLLANDERQRYYAQART